MNDSQLVQEYATSRSDDAFKALIDQYIGLVYSACLRQLKDRHLAEDATQAVFILLSQKAGALSQTFLSGWLLTTSRYACANIRRSQLRRRQREQVVAMQHTTTTETPDDDLLDLLDQALCHLKTHDRQALVLRYLEEQPISDVARKLGVSEEAARKRVNRSLEKLREYFSRQGITTNSVTLGALLTEQIPGAALPPAARQTITQGILQALQGGAQSTAAAVTIANGTQSMMILTKLKTAAVFTVIFALIGSTGWMISRALAENSSAPQTASPIAAPASSIPPIASTNPPPAVKPSAPVPLDLTTPENSLRSFFTAVKNGDHDSAYACLTADPNRAPNLMDAMLAWNFAQNRLVHAVNQTFGNDGAAVKHMITIDEVAHVITQNPDGTSQAVIDGDTATITTQIPAWLIAIVPQNYQPILRTWSNKKLYFHKQSEQWKFDIDNSMRISARILDGNHRPLDFAAKIALVMECAQADDQIAVAVSSGQMDTVDDAAAALNTAYSRIQKKHGVSSLQIDVLPAEGGNENR
jgi:RNA polymerase sigma factor (sigma-70 family)